jgi:hypothetical protein
MYELNGPKMTRLGYALGLSSRPLTRLGYALGTSSSSSLTKLGHALSPSSTFKRYNSIRPMGKFRHSMNEKVLDLPILAPIPCGQVGANQNLSSTKEPRDKYLGAEVAIHSSMTESQSIIEETEFYPTEGQDFGLIELTSILPGGMDVNMPAITESHCITPIEVTESQKIMEETNPFSIEGQDFDLIEPISISPGGMDINISVSIEFDCIPRIEVSGSPVLLEEEKVFGPIEADRTNGAKEQMLILDVEEKHITFKDGYLPSIRQLPILHLFPPDAAFSLINAVVFSFSSIYPLFILLALPSPLTLWTQGNLFIPMEGSWRRSFDRQVLPVGIIMEPPLLLGPLPHSSDPPSGIIYIWKWAYSL